MIGHERISRRRFYALGGLANPKLVRRQRGTSWTYYLRID